MFKLNDAGLLINELKLVILQLKLTLAEKSHTTLISDFPHLCHKMTKANALTMKAVCLSIAILFCVVNSACCEELIVAVSGYQKGDRTFRIADGLLTEIATRMGVKIRLIPLPAKRAALMLASAKIHADIARVAQYQQQVPAAIRVKEAMAKMPYYVYSKQNHVDINGWQSLKPYRIVIVRGFTFVDTHLADHTVSYVDSFHAAFSFLKENRADMLLDYGVTAEDLLKTAEFKDSGIRRLLPAVASISTYTFFAAKYVDLAYRYEQALLSMKADGSYLRIVKSTQ